MLVSVVGTAIVRKGIPLVNAFCELIVTVTVIAFPFPGVQLESGEQTQLAGCPDDGMNVSPPAAALAAFFAAVARDWPDR